jgi:hypothetical protein
VRLLELLDIGELELDGAVPGLLVVVALKKFADDDDDDDEGDAKTVEVVAGTLTTVVDEAPPALLPDGILDENCCLAWMIAAAFTA